MIVVGHTYINPLEFDMCVVITLCLTGLLLMSSSQERKAST